MVAQALHLVVKDFFLILWVFGFALSFAGVIATLNLFRKSKKISKSSLGQLPSVSILKPLKGMDPSLEKNLRSFFQLDYPKFELLFCVAEESDPAVAVARSLLQEFPHVSARISIGSCEVGVNPKVNNLIRSYEASSYDCVLISDSNTRVPPDFLRSIISQFGDDVALESSIVAGEQAEGISGRLDASFMDTFCAKGTALASVFNIPCVTGKSMLFRRSILEKIGGLRALSNEIAEDYVAGQLLHKLGYKVIVSCTPITQIVGKMSFKSFWDRHLRWGRIRKVYAPVIFFLEPLSLSTVSGVFGGIAGKNLFGWNPILVFFSHMLAWCILDLFLLKKMQKRISLGAIAAWWVGEFLRFPIWIHTALGNSVRWRGNRLTLQPSEILAAFDAGQMLRPESKAL